MLTYPINVVGLTHRRCVVVGGGAVALRKVEGLLAAGADIAIIAPECDEAVLALAASGRVTVLQRAYEPDDLAGAFIVIAATDDREANHAVSAEAMARGMLVNVVDDPEASNFIVPAVVRRGELTIAVSTGGASPALARRLREDLEARFGPEYEELLEILAELRPEIMARFAPGRSRLHAALSLSDGDLTALLREEGKEATLEHARRLLDLD